MSIESDTDHHDVETFNGLAVTSTPSQGHSSSDASADIDLLDVLSGCMEDQADVDQLTAGLLEMEDELKALVNDTSFLQFPCEILSQCVHVGLRTLAYYGGSLYGMCRVCRE